MSSDIAVYVAPIAGTGYAARWARTRIGRAVLMAISWSLGIVLAAWVLVAVTGAVVTW